MYFLKKDVDMVKEFSCSVVGLGKLGSPLALVLASKGYNVIGVDHNPEIVRSLNASIAPFQEPELQTYLEKHKRNFYATTSFEEAITNTDVTFVIVPTPSNSSGAFLNDYILSAMEHIGKILKNKNTYHLVSITSTVMPGSMDNEISKTLESTAGKKIGEKLGLCYSPAFIAIGSVIKNMLCPDMVLIGESDEQAGKILENIHKNICDTNPFIQRMNFINAELTKIAINTFVTTKISYANMLSEVCEKIPGADVNVITAAAGKDSRIGGKYLSCGLGYGGPCFPRDNIAFSVFARHLGCNAEIAEATDKINNNQISKLAKLIYSKCTNLSKIGILGLAYKPFTNLIEASQSIGLINLLVKDGYKVLAFDPLAIETSKSIFNINEVEFTKSAEECVKNADIIVIATPWPEFSKLSFSTLKRNNSKLIIIDCWRMFPKNTILDPEIELLYLGYGTDNQKKEAFHQTKQTTSEMA